MLASSLTNPAANNPFEWSGTTGDDVFRLVQDGANYVLAFNGFTFNLPGLTIDRPILIDGMGGKDVLEIVVQDQENILDATLCSLSGGTDDLINIVWEEVETIEVSSEQSRRAVRIISDNEQDIFSVTSEGASISGGGVTLSAPFQSNLILLESSARNANQVNVTGSEGEDSFGIESINLSDIAIAINGESQLRVSSVFPIDVDGGGGDDEIAFRTSSLDLFGPSRRSIELHPAEAVINGNGRITWQNIETQIAERINDIDVYDTGGDEQLRITEDTSIFTGDQYEWTLNEFTNLTVHATEGTDVVLADTSPYSFDVPYVGVEGGMGYGRGHRNGFLSGRIDVLNFDSVSVVSSTPQAVATLSSFNEGALITVQPDEDDLLVTLEGATPIRYVGDIRVGFSDRLADNPLLFIAEQGANDIEVRQQEVLINDRIIELEDVLELRFSADSEDDSITFFDAEDGDAVFTTRAIEQESEEREYSLEGRGYKFTANSFDNVKVEFSDGSDSYGLFYGIEGISETLKIGVDAPIIFETPSTEVVIEGLPSNRFNAFGNGAEDRVQFSGSEDVDQFSYRSSLFDERQDISNRYFSNDNPFQTKTFRASFFGFDTIDFDLLGGQFESFEGETYSDSAELSITPDQHAEIRFGSLIDGEETLNWANVETVTITGNGSATLFDTSAVEFLQLTEHGFSSDGQLFLGTVAQFSGDNGTIQADVASLNIVSSGNDTAFISNEYGPLESLIVGENAASLALAEFKLSFTDFETIDLTDFPSYSTIPITESDDVINLDFSADQFGFYIGQSGNKVLVNADLDLSIDGLGGDDLLVVKTPVNENVSLSTEKVSFGDQTVRWENVDSIVTQGHKDEAVATIFDSAGDDTFFFRSGKAALASSDGIQISAEGFSNVNTRATSGYDVARIVGAPTTTDKFFGTPTSGVLEMPEQRVSAFGFDLVAATSNGGRDLAYFTGSEGDDRFYGSPTSGRLAGDGFALNATGFESVVGRSGGGIDLASFTGSDGDDKLFAQPGFGRLELPEEHSITAVDFATVRSASGSGGNDEAQLLGSQGSDVFIAGDGFAQLQGEGYKSVANGFSVVNASGSDGGDTAYISDSPEDDYFFATPSFSYLQGTSSRNIARDFETVVAFASQGNDAAVLRDSDGDDRFDANPRLSLMHGSGFQNYAIGFGYVRGESSLGSDIAALRDSSGDDVFTASPTTAFLRGGGFFNEAIGFGVVRAFSSAGKDRANLSGSEGNDVYSGYRDLSSMSGNGFSIEAFAFGSVISSGLDGEDTAHFYDSQGEENVGLRGNVGWLVGDQYSFQVEGFETIYAYGKEGGTNQFFVDEPTFDWNRFGSWEDLQN